MANLNIIQALTLSI